MNQLVLAILSLHIDTPIGPWSSNAVGTEEHGLTVQHPQHARVDFSVDRDIGAWVSKVTSLGTTPVTVKVDAAWKPSGDLAGPTRILTATDMSRAARVITRDGGVVTGRRLDAASPEAFFRDRFTIQILPGEVLEISAAVEPCAASDVDGDGSVGASDVAITLGAWGATSLAADINRDGIVDERDLARLLGDFSASNTVADRPSSPEPQPEAESPAEGEPAATSIDAGK